MKNVLLIFSIVGFLVPNYFVLLESIETGNILLYTDPIFTMKTMFSSRINTIFSLDLLITVLAFFYWTFNEKRIVNKSLFTLWLVTILFGLAGGFPLYLFIRNRNVEDDL